jgi:hypothetical protein
MEHKIEILGLQFSILFLMIDAVTHLVIDPVKGEID